MFTPFTLNIKGNITDVARPLVMGIVNITPDSFYAGSRAASADAVKARVEKMVADGADILDVGACSTRPGAEDVAEEEEIERLGLGLRALREVAPDIPVSVDTWRARVAETAVSELGADIINDISGGDLDDAMFETVARLSVPYILMHMRGTPASMASMTEYADVTADVISDLSAKLRRLRLLGVSDVIVDPGFGFAKTLAQNYEMMARLDEFARVLDAPVLVGISRKSMITKALGITPENALNGTTVLNTLALVRGASVLRVHDVREAAEAVKLYSLSTLSPSVIL